jgi:membrane protein
MWLAWLQEKLFAREPSALRGLWGKIVRSARIAWFTAHEFRRDYCAERAATMAFVTIISLIPLAVLVFSIVGQFGYGDEFITYAKKEIFPLVAPDFQDKLEVWLDQHISKDAFAHGFGLLHILAILSLVASAIAVFATAERNFDKIWKVDRSRSYVQRFMVFWVVITVSPFVFLASTGVSDFWGIVRELAAKSIFLSAIYGLIVPVAIGFFGFTLVYYLMPSARVRIGSAMAGGVVAAILWELSKRTFYVYMGRSLTLYQGLAVVPLFLVWVYVNWFLALLGCEVAYAHQNLGVLTDLLERPGRVRQLPPALIGVELLRRIALAFLRGEKAPRLLSVARDLGASPRELERAAQLLVQAGVILERVDEPGIYSLAKAPETVRLDEVVSLFFAEEVPPELINDDLSGGKAGEGGGMGLAAFQRARAAYVGVFRGKTLKDVLPVDPAAPGADDGGEGGGGV